MVDFGNVLKTLHLKENMTQAQLAQNLLGLEHKQEIDLSGLSQEEINAIFNLIKAMKKNQGNFGNVFSSKNCIQSL